MVSQDFIEIIEILNHLAHRVFADRSIRAKSFHHRIGKLSGAFVHHRPHAFAHGHNHLTSQYFCSAAVLVAAAGAFKARAVEVYYVERHRSHPVFVKFGQSRNNAICARPQSRYSAIFLLTCIPA